MARMVGAASASESRPAGRPRMTGAMAMTNGEKKAHAVYCVRKGDTLDVVARRYGVGVR